MTELYRAFAGIGAGVALTLLTALMAVLMPAHASDLAPDQVSDGEARACREAAGAIEDRRGLPTHLLTAIGVAESGTYSKARAASFAWPWTVTSGSASWHLPSKEAAVAKVRALRQQGRENIDVGCFQVNLYWHGEHFADVAHALEPRANAIYAAEFLAKLYREHKAWSRAVAYYHSRTKAHNRSYRQRVHQAWQTVRERAVARQLAGGD